MLPDAFDAPQAGLYTGQMLGAGKMDLESTNGTVSAPVPFVKVDGRWFEFPSMLLRARGQLTLSGGTRLTGLATDPPKFELESYIANYTGK